MAGVGSAPGERRGDRKKGTPNKVDADMTLVRWRWPRRACASPCVPVFVAISLAAVSIRAGFVSSTLRSGLNALAKCIATENAADATEPGQPALMPGEGNMPLWQRLAATSAEPLGADIRANFNRPQSGLERKVGAPSRRFSAERLRNG